QQLGRQFALDPDARAGTLHAQRAAQVAGTGADRKLTVVKAQPLPCHLAGGTERPGVRESQSDDEIQVLQVRACRREAPLQPAKIKRLLEVAAPRELR